MAIVQEGIEHHQAHVPACLNWVATKSLDLGKARTGQEELTEEIVVVEEYVGTVQSQLSRSVLSLCLKVCKKQGNTKTKLKLT